MTRSRRALRHQGLPRETSFPRRSERRRTHSSGTGSVATYLGSSAAHESGTGRYCRSVVRALATRALPVDYRTVKSSLVLVALSALASSSCSKSDDDPGGCVVARRVDQCCSIPIAATERELEQQPCLQRWDRAADVAACPAAQQCNLRVCPDTFALGPWTRIAERSGSGCVFKHECNSAADCTFASNRSGCCACPEWVPQQLLTQDPCYVSSGQNPGAACDVCVDALPCDACAASAAGQCADGAGWKKCLP